MKLSISVEKLHDRTVEKDKISDPVKALDMVEILRLQAGKFLYEYPTGFRRVIEVIRKE